MACCFSTRPPARVVPPAAELLTRVAAPSQMGMTALHYAVDNGHSDIVRFMCISCACLLLLRPPSSLLTQRRLRNC